MVALNTNSDTPQPRFPLGQIVATPGAWTAMEEADQHPGQLLLRHRSGDWGEVDAGDARANDDAVAVGERILSAYTLGTGVKIWIITESDRSVTTFLLPDEY